MANLTTLCRTVRQRFWVLTATILGICAPIYAMTWCFDVFENIASGILITGSVTVLPIIQLLSVSGPLTKISNIGWLSAFWLITLALVIGDEYGSRFITFNALLVGLALPYGWVFWQVLRHEWILSAGFVLALAAAMIYWIAALIESKESFDLILVPLLVILVFGVFWAPITMAAFMGARICKDRNIAGPASQALAMTMLFLPVTLVAIALPGNLGLNTTWSNVSLALIGISLSGVISDPLRRMFLEWGNLKPEKSPPK